MISKSIGINRSGNLTIGNADCVELAKRFGTPLYVFDESLIRKTCSEFKRSIDDYYNGTWCGTDAKCGSCVTVEKESQGWKVLYLVSNKK